MVAMKSIQDWIGTPGTLISWDPSPASAAKMADAPISDVPVSYQQEQHIRAFRTHREQGTDMARLLIPAWDMPGRCDTRAMTHVINAYLRRHDTYHSRFEFTDADQVVRRTARNPRDIKFVPTEHGEVTAAQWREHVLATPDPLQWNCFSFGVIQRADHFTFYISVDHVHTDAMFMGLVLVEIHLMYTTLVGGGAPLQLPEPGSYDDYCLSQHDYTSALSPASPEVAEWVDIASANGGSKPRFPLPLGDPSVPCSGELMTVRLLDRQQSERFEAVCAAAGARFIGGVFACGALTDLEFSGNRDYYIITPTTTRRTPEEFMTTGWFTGVVPVTVQADPSDFGATARHAQQSFDGGLHLAHVPFELVVELGKSAGIRNPEPGVPMLSYLDAGLPPLSPGVIAQWEAMNGRLYTDARSAFQVGLYVNRTERETALTVCFPDNPIARESIERYVRAMQTWFLRVADGGTADAGRESLSTAAHGARRQRSELVPVVGR
ncbi:acyltransferase [Mycobacterium sp. 852013-51886_SCH5428379]|uniref:condensation domain-containing protein n=1 Tax=Mycobacterium sp. 852013-51886_SCH5428379 TaxID=1834111 RepID=UPI0007FBA019|nr:condensation domain-containing protein [Mycobacterium sp. 852013-51886_SCH5428379]OBB59714.1 acyltransferase [Mycobacterium sp. 852013-51886_SCH5428379]